MVVQAVACMTATTLQVPGLHWKDSVLTSEVPVRLRDLHFNKYWGDLDTGRHPISLQEMLTKTMEEASKVPGARISALDILTTHPIFFSKLAGDSNMQLKLGTTGLVLSSHLTRRKTEVLRGECLAQIHTATY